MVGILLTLFLNIISQYLDEPLAYLTVTYTPVSDFISPNVMSLIGVGVAAVSAKFLSNEELKYRQLGVLVFAVRDYIDALDGSIFRERSHTHASGQVGEKLIQYKQEKDFIQVPIPNSLGYFVDGVCDGIGDIFRFIAILFLLQRHPSKGTR